MFVIDTGVETRDPLWSVPAWFRDQLPADAADAYVIHQYGFHLIGALNNHAKVETVRKHVLGSWPFLALLGETHPDVFDEFWMAYAERLAT